MTNIKSNIIFCKVYTTAGQTFVQQKLEAFYAVALELIKVKFDCFPSITNNANYYNSYMYVWSVFVVFDHAQLGVTIKTLSNT